MVLKRKILGLVSFSVGLGMILALMVPSWTCLIAVLLLAGGVWNLFLC
ncbi:MAG: hypothetical protein LBT44_00245 [Clostridiales bacterium]|jgi:hypothetical protein|nr:hypothetical protein [Clostridiales bacterium]